MPVAKACRADAVTNIRNGRLDRTTRSDAANDASSPVVTSAGAWRGAILDAANMPSPRSAPATTPITRYPQRPPPPSSRSSGPPAPNSRIAMPSTATRHAIKRARS